MLVLEKLWKQLSLLPQWLLRRKRTSSVFALLCVREFTDTFFWPLDKFLYLTPLPLGTVTLGGVNEKSKKLKIFNKVVWARPERWKSLLFLRENFPCWTNDMVPSHTFSTARLCWVHPCTNTWLGQEVEVGLPSLRSAEDNYTDLLISLSENCHTTSEEP